MFKLLDNAFTALSYFLLAAVTIVAIAVGFTYFPTITGILIAAFVLSPFEPWVRKQTEKVRSFSAKFSMPTSPKKPSQSIIQAFNTGFKKGIK